MSALPFHLVPFDPCQSPPSLTLNGEIERRGSLLRLRYVLQGRLDALCLPPPVGAPRRLDDLWRSTCLECFLAAPGHEPYWEVNLSPSGHWNVYRFAGYRRGIAPETEITRLPFEAVREPRSFRLDLEMPLPSPLHEAPSLQVAVSAVILEGNGGLSYWALSHPRPEADFHDRGGFLISL